MYEIGHPDKHAGNSKGRISTTLAREDFSVTRIEREELSSLIQGKANSVVEAERREEIRNMFRNLAKETDCVVFITEYSAATDENKDPFLSFTESIVRQMIYCGVLHEIFK